MNACGLDLVLRWQVEVLDPLTFGNTKDSPVKKTNRTSILWFLGPVYTHHLLCNTYQAMAFEPSLIQSDEEMDNMGQLGSKEKNRSAVRVALAGVFVSVGRKSAAWRLELTRRA